MKLFQLLNIFTFFLILFFNSCIGIKGTNAGGIPDTVFATGVSFEPPFDQGSFDVETGQELKIIPTVQPLNYTGSVSWKSEDISLAVVNGEGVVYFRDIVDTVDIFADVNTEFNIMSAVKRGIVRFVIMPRIEIQSVIIDGPNKLSVGDSLQLSIDIQPVEAQSKSVVWQSDNQSVAIVDTITGLVVAKAPGIVHIFARIGRNEGAFQHEITVDPLLVIAKEFIIVTNSRTGDSDTILNRIINDPDLALQSIIKPAHYNNGSIVWTSSNEAVAEISPRGILSFDGEGASQIIGRVGDAADTLLVIVQGAPLTDVNLVSYDGMIVSIGGALQLTTEPVPSNAIVDLVLWRSLDSIIAVVDAVGVVSGISSGVVEITLESESFFDTIEITVQNVPLIKLIVTSNDTITIGASSLLIVQPVPIYAAPGNISWFSSNIGVATVTNGGLVQGLAEGLVTIQVSSDALASFVALSQVLVKASVTPVVSIVLEPQVINTIVGSPSQKIETTIFPVDHTDGDGLWVSTNTTVAIVTQAGNVSFIGAGNTKIISTIGFIRDTTDVFVTSSISLNSIGIDGRSIVNQNGVLQLRVMPSPSGADVGSVTWTSSLPSIASVNASGQVLGRTVGMTTITVISGLFTAVKQVTVVTPVLIDSISISGPNNVALTKTYQYVATFNPADATNKDLDWSVDDLTKATISSSGLLNPLQAGTSIITAMTKDGGNKQSTFSVNINALGISATSVMTVSHLNKKVGQSIDLSNTLTIVPINHTDQIVWSVVDTLVAVINQAGILTFVGVGITDLVVTVGSASTMVRISARLQIASSIQIDLADTVFKEKGSLVVLTATVTPQPHNSGNVSWRSSKPLIAFVASLTGVTNFIKNGTAEIIATVGAIEDTVVVIVETPATSIDITSNFLIKDLGDSSVTLSATVLPNDYTGSVRWRSLDEMIVMVDSLGTVSYVGVGFTSIVASAGAVSDSVTVSIGNQVISLTLSTQSFSCKSRDQRMVTATAIPSDHTNGFVSWSTSDALIASVLSSGDGRSMGLIECISNGNATIIATIGNLVTDSVVVTVSP